MLRAIPATLMRGGTSKGLYFHQRDLPAVTGTVAQRIADHAASAGPRRLEIEHPTGFFTVELDVTGSGRELSVNRSALLRTARKLMRGEVYVPSAVWGAA